MLSAELKVHNAQFDAARARAQGWDLRMELDYMPRTFVWMLIFDFPAVLAAAPFGIADALCHVLPFCYLPDSFGTGVEEAWNDD
jgi:hypothetical protein